MWHSIWVCNIFSCWFPWFKFLNLSTTCNDGFRRLVLTFRIGDWKLLTFGLGAESIARANSERLELLIKFNIVFILLILKMDTICMILIIINVSLTICHLFQIVILIRLCAQTCITTGLGSAFFRFKLYFSYFLRRCFLFFFYFFFIDVICILWPLLSRLVIISDKFLISGWIE